MNSVAATSTEQNVSLARWYALAILTAVYISNIADRYVISTLIEPIKAELGLSDTEIGFLTGTALAVFYTGMGIPLGLLADRVERRRLIAISIAAWSAMTAACGAAGNFTQLLLARIGVGIGEAGGTPASQSMLADLFPFRLRIVATSIFALGAAAGSMVGSIGGGMVSDQFGWRMAFIALAIPGLLLALIVRLTLQEPARGALDSVNSTDTPSLRETIAFIRTQRSLLHVLAAGTVVTYWGWGLLWWTPAFLQRSYQLSTGQAGTLVGTISGVAGAFGILAGVALIHGSASRQPARQARILAIATVVGTLASIGAYMSRDLSSTTTMLWLFVPAAYINIAPILTLTQSLVLARMRALSCAILLFGANIANLALAPQIIGALSDLFQKFGQGSQSLRWSLLLTTFTGFWAAYHFWAAQRDVTSDLARAGAIPTHHS